MSEYFKKLKVKYLTAKNAKICKLEAAESKFDNIQSNQINSQQIVSKNINTENISVSNNGNIKNLSSDNANINNLQVKNLNGRNLNCEGQTFNNINSQLVTIDPLKYPEFSGFNKTVWDNLVLQTLIQKDALQQRLQCGRLQVKYIQDEFGCVQCPPDGLQNCTPECEPPVPPGEVCACPQEIGVCPSVPLNIFGIKSVLPLNVKTCGSGDSAVELISSISYNLNVKNVTGTLADRVVTILVQSGYLDGNGDFVYDEIDFGNRQFTATLDTTYGEKFTGTILLDTNFINRILIAPNSGALIQLVVFAEDGVEIDIAGNIQTKNNATSRDVQVIRGPVNASYLSVTQDGRLSNANVEITYNFPDSSTIYCTLTLLQTPPNTRAIFRNLPTRVGDENNFIEFGIENTNGSYSIVVIGQNATSSQIGESYVITQKFADGGWVLFAGNQRIPVGQTGGTPFIALNTPYQLNITRESTSDTETIWRFIIVNQSTGDSVNMGTITMPAGNQNLTATYQITEYYGPGAPLVNCSNLPLTVHKWGFPTDSSDPQLTNPVLCGQYSIKIDTDAKTVDISLGNGA